MATFEQAWKWKLTPDGLADLLSRYAAGERPALIAASLGVSEETVYHHARRNELTPKTTVYAERICPTCGIGFRPDANYSKRKYCSQRCGWTGSGPQIATSQTKEGATVLTNGYRVIHVPKGHVSWLSTRRKRNSRVMEHVLIAETALGRPLKKGEVVHHINCDRLDNRRPNLLICTYAYHAWLHGEMSRRYAQEKFA